MHIIQKLLLSCCACAVGTISVAQEFTHPVVALKGKKELIYGIDNRRVHLHEQSALIYGAYTGIGFGEALRLKIGVSGTPLEKGRLFDENQLRIRNRLLYVSLGEEFDFFNVKRFGFTTYLLAGAGYNFYRKLDENGHEVARGRNLILPLETGMNATYALFPGFKLKVGFGWRFVFPEASSDLSGYYVKTGVSIHVKKLKAYIKSVRQ